MCKEEIVPSRVEFFARALEIRPPNIDLIGGPIREEDDDDDAANEILFQAIVKDLHKSEIARLTQRDIRDLKELDMLPGSFYGDDGEQRHVELQVAEWAKNVGREPNRSAENPGYQGEDEGEDEEDEVHGGNEDEEDAAAAEEHSEITSPRITSLRPLREPDRDHERNREYSNVWSRPGDNEDTARLTQTRSLEGRAQISSGVPTDADPGLLTGAELDVQICSESPTAEDLLGKSSQQLPASMYDPTTLATSIEQHRKVLSAIIASEFDEVGEEVRRARSRRVWDGRPRGVSQPEMRERFPYEGPDALYRLWAPIVAAAVHGQDSNPEMNDAAGPSGTAEEEDEELLSEDVSGSRPNEKVQDGDEKVSAIADAVTLSIAMAIAITLANIIAIATLATLSLLLTHRRWRRQRR